MMDMGAPRALPHRPHLAPFTPHAVRREAHSLSTPLRNAHPLKRGRLVFSPAHMRICSQHKSCDHAVNVSCTALLKPISAKKRTRTARPILSFDRHRSRRSGRMLRSVLHTLPRKMSFRRKRAEAVLTESFVNCYRHGVGKIQRSCLRPHWYTYRVLIIFREQNRRDERLPPCTTSRPLWKGNKMKGSTYPPSRHMRRRPRGCIFPRHSSQKSLRGFRTP